MTEPTLRALSLGAGVQSTTIALMACDGTLPKPDVAIFADTGWEPRAVYDHLDRLAVELDRAGIELIKVANGNLRADALDPDHRYASVPYFVRNPDGSEGMGRRQCTSEYKLKPITRKVRELLGAEPPHYRRVQRGKVCEQWIGFSTDEIHRVSDKGGVLYVRKAYPLLDLGMSRSDCQRWLGARGWTTQKSACIGCPYHGNRQWRALRDTCECGHSRRAHQGDEEQGWATCEATVSAGPAANGLDYGVACGCVRFAVPEWDDAVAFDEAIRKGGARGLPLNGEAFLHRSRVPLSIAPIDKVTSAEWHDRQTDLLVAVADAEAGYDPDEDGDADGCSPYGCRSGAPVA